MLEVNDCTVIVRRLCLTKNVADEHYPRGVIISHQRRNHAFKLMSGMLGSKLVLAHWYSKRSSTISNITQIAEEKYE